MTEYWRQRESQARWWNRHPWNQKSKELLQELPDDAIDSDSQEPYNQSDPAQLYCLQLMKWGMVTLEEFQYDNPIYERRKPITLSDIWNHLNSLIVDWSPTEVMQYLTSTLWEHPEYNGDPPEMGGFQKAKTPAEGAMKLLDTLNDHMNWRML